MSWLRKLSGSRTAGAFTRDGPHDGRSSGNTTSVIGLAALKEQCSALVSDRKWHEAAACYRRAVALDPGDAESHAGLAAALNEQKSFAHAQPHWEKAIALRPDWADACYGLGLALMGQGRPAESIEAFRKALERRPDFETVYRDLCLALFQSGKVDDARRVVTEGLSAHPDSADLHFYLGNLLNHEGDLDSAADCYRKTLSLRPGFAPAHHNLGSIHKKQGKLGEALSDFISALSISPDFVDAHIEAGAVMQDQGKLDEAAAHYRHAIALAPNAPAAHVSLGSILEKQGQFDQALDCFNRALVLSPDDPGANVGMGLALERHGRPDEAICYYEQAIRASPRHIDANLLLGNLLLKQGARDRALACFKTILATQPDHAVVHLANALTGRTTERAPNEYVEWLFDDYAARFDSELTQALQYNVPQQLAAALQPFANSSREPWDILDVGCGTGLVGVAVARYARRLVGVDLSRKMLEAAGVRGIYQRLEHSELLSMLEQEASGTFDVVLAADVFVYLGKLDDLTRQIFRILRPGGLLGFSVESLDAIVPAAATQNARVDYRLNSTGRFAHSLDYLEQLASASGFAIHQQSPIHVRIQDGVPVAGYLALWGRTDNDAHR